MKKKLLIIFTAVMISIMTFTATALAAETGWNEDGTKYCIESTEDGDVYASGIYYIESEEAYYIFGEDGVLITDETFDTVDGILYQFTDGKGSVFSGTYDGILYSEGKKVSDTVDGIYYVDGAAFTGTHDGYYYSNGKKYTGTHDGYYYNKGKKYTGFHNSLYYKGGKKYTGFHSRRYYSAGKDITSKNGTDRVAKLGGKYLYVTSAGKIYDCKSTGVHKMGNGKYYYIYKNDQVYHVSKAGIQSIGKKNYYFRSSSSIYCDGTVHFEKIGDATYRIGSKGNLIKGWRTIDGNKYYMSKKTFKRYENKVGKIGGNKYYFNKQGMMQTNKWRYKRGLKRYYFGSDGRALKNCSRYIGGYKYFFNKNGVLQTDLMKYKGLSWVLSQRLIIKVSRVTNSLTWYAMDSNGSYSIPVKQMTCTVGTEERQTPTGTFSTGGTYRWKQLGGGENGGICYGQFVTNFYGACYFHSVCYKINGDNHRLFRGAYNNLGNAGSHGCIRLQCGNAYWMYKVTTKRSITVIINDNKSKGAFGKEKIKKIKTHYDPTDPFVKKK